MPFVQFDLRRASRDFPQVASQSVRLVPLCGVPLIGHDLQLLQVCCPSAVDWLLCWVWTSLGRMPVEWFPPVRKFLSVSPPSVPP